MRLEVGQPAPQFTVTDLNDHRISLTQYAGWYVLLSFHRFAVCPLCDLRLWHLGRRYQEYRERGLYMMTFVESTPDRTHWYLDRLRCPFPVVPDLRGKIYNLYGLETSARGVAHALLWRQDAYREAASRQLGGWNLLHMTEGHFTRMPASFVIGPDQRIHLAYYGRDAGDFLPFADLDRFLDSRPSPHQPMASWR
jgi:thioredoxin-dependent peroxiredoxin